MPRRRDIFGRSVLLGLIGGAVMGEVGLVVILIFLLCQRL